MTLGLVARIVGFAVVFVTAIAHAQSNIALKSIAVDLPDSDQQFVGPGADRPTATALPVIRQTWC